MTAGCTGSNGSTKIDLGCASGLGEDLSLFVNSLFPIRLRFGTDGIPLSGSFQSCHPIRALWALGGSPFAGITNPGRCLFDVEMNRILKAPAPRQSFFKSAPLSSDHQNLNRHAAENRLDLTNHEQWASRFFRGAPWSAMSPYIALATLASIFSLGWQHPREAKTTPG